MVHAKEVEIARQLLDVELPDDPRKARTHVVRHGSGSDHKAVAREGRARAGSQRGRGVHPVHAVEFLFPHYFLLPFFTSMSSYERIIEGHLRGVAPETLAKATHLLGGNFDGRILELGL